MKLLVLITLCFSLHMSNSWSSCLPGFVGDFNNVSVNSDGSILLSGGQYNYTATLQGGFIEGQTIEGVNYETYTWSVAPLGGGPSSNSLGEAEIQFNTNARHIFLAFEINQSTQARIQLFSSSGKLVREYSLTQETTSISYEALDESEWVSTIKVIIDGGEDNLRIDKLEFEGEPCRDAAGSFNPTFIMVLCIALIFLRKING